MEVAEVSNRSGAPGEFLVMGIDLAVALAVLIGVSLGALGSGGSIITMPVLVYVAGIDPRQAVAMSLAIVGMTSLVASCIHFRQGNFHPKAAGLYGGSGIFGAYIGARFTHLVPSATLMIIFAALMLLIGVLMLVRSTDNQARGRCILWRCLLVGGLVGVLTGFLGVGGGFLIVPALVFTSGLSTKQAVGSSLAIIAVNSAAGLIGQLHYVRLDWPLAGAFLIAALVGMGVGILIVQRVPERALRRAFAVALLVVGVAIGWESAIAVK